VGGAGRRRRRRRPQPARPGLHRGGGADGRGRPPRPVRHHPAVPRAPRSRVAGEAPGAGRPRARPRRDGGARGPAGGGLAARGPVRSRPAETAGAVPARGGADDARRHRPRLGRPGLTSPDAPGKALPPLDPPDVPRDQPASPEAGERLQKVLARAGLGSRRACEELIEEGRVEVNGLVATLGRRVDPEQDRVTLDGVTIPVRPGLVYYLLNKPAGVVTTAHDPEGRPTVVDLVSGEPRVFPVGRLDRDTEGLLLLTN